MSLADRDVAGALVCFWREAGEQKWFAEDAAFDALFRRRFLRAHAGAARRRHDQWMLDAEGALALILLLDQFPRNAFRGTAHAFATDSLAQHFALAAIDAGYAADTEASLRIFLYLPLQHAEDLALQRRSVALTEPLGGAALEAARKHLDIIERFGRFPHRNAVLGRETTPAERAFLDAGGFAG